MTSPTVLLADEPTSGLDACAAKVVLEVLSGYRRNHYMSVICTIHQPRTAIWKLFDNVLLLSKGRCLYFGPAKYAMPWFSDKLGYPRDPESSVPDYLLDLVNINFPADTRTMQGHEDVDEAAARFRETSLYASRCATAVQKIHFDKNLV